MKNQRNTKLFVALQLSDKTKRQINFLTFKVTQKLLENIDLQTKKLRFYSLICDSFVLTENEEKEI